MMAEEYEERDLYVLLDFQGKDTSRFLKQPSVYFRMLNLNEAKPIVEMGEDVYEGTYDDAIGTNVYFEEVDNPPPNTNVFETQTPITLQYLLKQTKILSMKKIGTKPKLVMNTNPTESVNIHIEDDYRVLLEKFENDKLNVEEYIADETVADGEDEKELPSDKSENEGEEEQVEQWQPSQLPSRQSLVPEWYTSAQEIDTSANSQPQASHESKRKQDELDKSTLTKSVDTTYIKYVKLQKLAEQPTKHEIKLEVVEGNKFEQPLHSIPKNDFIVWKNLVMQSVEQESVNFDINKDKIEDFVDIEKSIKAGIIPPSNACPRVFTKEEKRELLSFKNFINVSPLMKLIMLQDYVQLEKACMEQMTPEDLNTVGEDGCTVKERFKLLENFKEELRSHIILRLQDEQANDETLTQQFENSVTLNLSDNEDLCDTDISYSSDDDDIDEQQSDSKPEGEAASSDMSESEQPGELQLEEESSNLSDAEGNPDNAMNVDQCNAAKTV